MSSLQSIDGVHVRSVEFDSTGRALAMAGVNVGVNAVKTEQMPTFADDDALIILTTHTALHPTLQ